MGSLLRMPYGGPNGLIATQLKTLRTGVSIHLSANGCLEI